MSDTEDLEDQLDQLEINSEYINGSDTNDSIINDNYDNYEDEYICPAEKCGLKFASQVALDNHFHEHYFDNDKYICGYPGCTERTKYYTREHDYIKHKSKHSIIPVTENSIVPTLYTCSRCRKVYTDIRKYDIHMGKHPEENDDIPPNNRDLDINNFPDKLILNKKTISLAGKKLSDFPEILETLDRTMHPDLDKIKKMAAGSNKFLNWICDKCNETYQKKPNHRCKDSACPKYDCSMRKRANTNAELYDKISHLDEPKVPKIEVESRIDSVPEPSADDVEEWKDFREDMMLSTYEASSLGRIRNKENGYIFECGARLDGYIRSKFKLDNKIGGDKYFHKLIAEAFIDNPGSKCTVNHINTDKSDNRVINLEWATHSEQQMKHNNKPSKEYKGKAVYQYSMTGNFLGEWISMKSAERALKICGIGKYLKGSQTHAGGFKWRRRAEVDIDPNEIWKEVPLGDEFIKTSASSFGRIKFNDEPTYGTKTPNGYYQATLKTKAGGRPSRSVHILVCMAFFEKPEGKDYVNHKDLDKGNNKPENLEWTTNKENSDHYQQNKNKLCRLVIEVQESNSNSDSNNE
jgi:hypothetical protein